MLKLPPLLARLRGNRGAAAAVIVAVTLPALLGAAGLGTEVAFVQAQLTGLQAAADAAAGAGRQALRAENPGYQSAATADAQLLANGNIASSLAPADVEQGWWDIAKKRFGSSATGQTGLPFNNAVRVTTRIDYKPVFAKLFGVESIPLKRSAVGYKCSNTDYPLTLIPDDPNPPSKPAIYLQWPADGSDEDQSWYYQNGGRKNPVFKFYSPTDDEDVSFVVVFNDNPDPAKRSKLQVDTYCRGTYLVVPDGFDWKDKFSDDGSKPNLTAQIFRGSTNNNFDVFADQDAYPLEFRAATYNMRSPRTNSRLRPDYVHVTPYPNANGIQYWASEGSPTPDRRTILVK